MSKQNHLNRAQKNNRAGKANDEFYTPYEAIEKELSNYVGKLTGKTVYCPCDDWKWSNFVKYFIDNFEKHGLKKLIATAINFDGKSVKFEYDGKIPKIYPLDGNGDFRSEECRQIMSECDVVVTNPPFSILSKFILQVVGLEKKYVIVGPPIILKYTTLARLVRDRRILAGYSGRFSIKSAVSGTVAGCYWWQNFGWSGRSCPSTTKFRDMWYKVFDGRPDIINVDRVKQIPMDYDGLIGVPVTFVLDWNPDEFELLGLLGGNCPSHDWSLGEPVVDGKYKFTRLVIKRRKE